MTLWVQSCPSQAFGCPGHKVCCQWWLPSTVGQRLFSRLTHLYSSRGGQWRSCHRELVRSFQIALPQLSPGCCRFHGTRRKVIAKRGREQQFPQKRGQKNGSAWRVRWCGPKASYWVQRYHNTLHVRHCPRKKTRTHASTVAHHSLPDSGHRPPRPTWVTPSSPRNFVRNVLLSHSLSLARELATIIT